MEKQKEDNSEERVQAGRGVVQNQNANSNKNTTVDQRDEADRPDDRARKAGC